MIFDNIGPYQLPKHGITFVACFDDESNQKIKETLEFISNYRLCKIPLKNGNRKDIDTLPFHSTLSSWNIQEEQIIIEQIRKFFFFESFTTDFKITSGHQILSLQPVQEEQLRQLQIQAYNLQPRESYFPETYKLHSTLNINPDSKQIKEQYQILKNIRLNLKIISVKLFEIYPADLVCSVDDAGFHLNKDIPLNLPPQISSDQISIEKDEENPFSGIINYLIYSVKVYSSSICNDDLARYGPINVLNKKSTNPFSSKNEENSWIAFDFGNHLVKPTSYEIMSSDAMKNYSHMKSWVLEGSNDFEQWEIIDSNEDCEFLNDVNAMHSFEISDNSGDSFRFLRLRQTGENCRGKHFMKFKQIEFYGEICKKPSELNEEQ